MPIDPRAGAPFEAEITALLDRERTDPHGEADRRAARWRRLEHAALAVAAAGAAPALHAAAGVARAAADPSLAGRLRKLLAWALSSKAGGAALLVLGGGAAGALLESRYGARDRHDPTAALVPARTAGAPALQASPSSAASEQPVVPSVNVDSLPVAPSVPRAAVSAPPAASASATPLGEERRLLDRAGTAVGRRAYAAALDTLHEVEDRFPRGHLVEERELLFVQALAGSGRTAEAAERARAFETHFPQSIFLPAVKAASPRQEE